MTSKQECETCQTLSRWSPEGLEPGKRPTPIIKQVFESQERDGHTCEWVICDDCDEYVCECDSYRCEWCDARMCPDCNIDTNDGSFCRYCCSSGYSYHAVEELAEKNYRLLTALRSVVDGYAAGYNPRWLAQALKELQ
jgi:hypothetical protein